MPLTPLRSYKMKRLTLALLLCSLVPLSNAACFVKPPLKKGAIRCQDHTDGTWHAVGSKWRNSGCMDCTCESCCHAYGRPTNYPEDCVAVFDPLNCQYTVHKRNNPDELCPHGAVGK